MHIVHSSASLYRAVINGFLLVFTFGILVELLQSPLLIMGALGAITGGVILARYAAHHFHGEHTHVGDAAIDIIAIAVLILANILHPMIDGFSFYETLSQSVPAGAILGVSIVGHEVFRQWAIIESVREHMRRAPILIISTALLGIAGGIGLGIVGTTLSAQHEHVADIATVFAYAFIIAEFYFGGHHHKSSKNWLFIGLGLLIGVLFTFVLPG